MKCYLVLKKEGNPAICDKMDESWGHRTEVRTANWSRPGAEQYCMIPLTWGI